MTFINGGQWPNPKKILIKLYCIFNKSTLEFYRTNIFDGSTLMFVEKIPNCSCADSMFLCRHYILLAGGLIAALPWVWEFPWGSPYPWEWDGNGNQIFPCGDPHGIFEYGFIRSSLINIGFTIDTNLL